MVIEAHIGLLDSPNFDFYGGNFNGNLPESVTHPILLLPAGRNIMEKIWSVMRNDAENSHQARRLDWGAYGIILDRQGLIDFIEPIYDKKIY